MRKLPIYILLDTSGSMRGEPIEAVKAGLRSLFSSLRRDPHALESAHVCVITFDREAKVLLPMSGLDGVKNMPEIPPLQSSPTNLGEALALMCDLYDKDVVTTTASAKGDWLPLALVMTDGSPSDTALFNAMCDRLNSPRYPFASIIGCAAGPKAKVAPLQKFATEVVSLETMDSNSFARFWAWVSSSFSWHSLTTGMGMGKTPQAPGEVKMVF
jgi:uncharacterized protein YegL